MGKKQRQKENERTHQMKKKKKLDMPKIIIDAVKLLFVAENILYLGNHKCIKNY